MNDWWKKDNVKLLIEDEYNTYNIYHYDLRVQKKKNEIQLNSRKNQIHFLRKTKLVYI